MMLIVNHANDSTTTSTKAALTGVTAYAMPLPDCILFEVEVEPFDPNQSKNLSLLAPDEGLITDI